MDQFPEARIIQHIIDFMKGLLNLSRKESSVKSISDLNCNMDSYSGIQFVPKHINPDRISRCT